MTDDSEPPAGVLFLNLMGRPPSTVKNITSSASASRIILPGSVSSPVRGNLFAVTASKFPGCRKVTGVAALSNPCSDFQ